MPNSPQLGPLTIIFMGFFHDIITLVIGVIIPFVTVGCAIYLSMYQRDMGYITTLSIVISTINHDITNLPRS